MPIFDTHTHYDDKAYDADRFEVIEGLAANGVAAFCNIGASMQGTRDSIAYARKYNFAYAAAGVHPDEVHELNDSTWSELRQLAEESSVTAIGEIGLDYHGFDVYEGKPDKETQKHWFRKQLELALELDKPVVIHSRNAAQDTLEMLQWAHGEGLGRTGAVIHCFSYSTEIALKYIEMGFYIGIGGVLTYEGQKKLTKAAAAIPADRILLETDCPYLTPVPVRKDRERNNSAYLCYVRDRLAEIRGIRPEEIESITWENAHRFYRI